MSESVMVASDLKTQHAEGLSAVKTLRYRYGIDAEEYDSEDALRAEVRDRRGRA